VGASAAAGAQQQQQQQQQPVTISTINFVDLAGSERLPATLADNPEQERLRQKEVWRRLGYGLGWAGLGWAGLGWAGLTPAVGPWGRHCQQGRAAAASCSGSCVHPTPSAAPAADQQH
jgi:hypothetical protein